LKDSNEASVSEPKEPNLYKNVLMKNKPTISKDIDKSSSIIVGEFSDSLNEETKQNEGLISPPKQEERPESKHHR